MALAAPLTSALLSPKPPSVAVASTARGGGVVEAIDVPQQAHNKNTWGYMQVRNKDTMSCMYIGVQQDTRSF